MREVVFKIALAGLLHDIGKFAQRREVRSRKHTIVGEEVLQEVFSSLVPFDWRDDLGDVIKFHHSDKKEETGKPIVKAVIVADWLVSAERLSGHPEQSAPEVTGLIPVTATVELDREYQVTGWKFPLRALTIAPEVDTPPIFPKQGIEVGRDDYIKLWSQFTEAMQSFPSPIDTYSRFTGLMSTLRLYTTQIPSATPWSDEKHKDKRTVPDVSLYDHLKVTAAIAPCLLRLPGEHPDHLEELHQMRSPRIFDDTRPVAQLLRADLSGIQSFIYRIVTPERDKSHRSTAKRLRGRSFYLSLLTEVIADWFLRELDLTPANVLFIGGGRFDLLLPIDHKTGEKVHKLQQDLQEWLAEKFYGTVGLVLACENLLPGDFRDLGRATATLDKKLTAAKQQKFSGVLNEAFFIPEKFKHVCDVCGLTPTQAGSPTCDLCKLHLEIGQSLPRAAYLARLYNAQPLKTSKTAWIKFAEPLNVQVALLKSEAQVEELLAKVDQAGVEAVIYSLNDTSLSPAIKWPAQTAPAQFYLANAAPLHPDDQVFSFEDYDDRAAEIVEELLHPDGQVFSFEEMAELSVGTKLLGVLKADVDHLGLIFSLGLAPLTISRTAALSHMFDHFFGGYLNTLCRKLTIRWQEDLAKNQERKADLQQALQKLRQESDEDGPVNLDRLDSLFYIVYAGGDDLLIIGPWDQTVELAQQLYRDFRVYTCENPNITLSAGITLVKPHFPVQRFVELVGEALEQSKNKGRNRLTLFDQTVLWRDEGATSFDELHRLARDLYDDAGQIPRTLIHDMLRLRKQQELKMRNGKTKPIIAPQLLYLFARRLPVEVREKYKRRLLDAWPGIQIPLSYVSLKTRKE
ncbi:MAG: type III-A CRISPR-associated protein Cas10/Csm1 [Anaerolineae bacterium]|nr:type III-A CRISPR-associated protein Cas10/Csm1 [Anaerolineae bacterium]